MNSILITGATSMIGVALIEEALANETEVFAIVRNGTRRLSRLPSSPLLHVVFIDSLNEYQSILKNITKPIDVFYHLLGYIQKSNTEMSLYCRTRILQYR